MKKQTIGLAMIVRDEASNIERVLRSAAPHVDVVYLTDTGSKDDTVKIARKVCKSLKKPIKVSRFKWIDNFAAARNFNYKQVETDWVLWVDADDTIENGELVPQYVAAASQRGVTGMYLTYRYKWAKTDKGEVDEIVHPKLRLTRNRMYRWFDGDLIHENLYPIGRATESFEDGIAIKHHKTEEEYVEAGKRNLRILKKKLKKEKNNPDPRTLFLMGRETHHQGKLDTAKKYLKKYLKVSGWGGEKMLACSLLCEMAEQRGDFNEEEKYAFEAVKSLPDHPLPYLLVAKVYSHRGDYSKVVDWVTQSLTKKVQPGSGEMQNPQSLAKTSSILLAEAYAETDVFDKSISVLYKYLESALEGEKQEMVGHIEMVKMKEMGQKTLEGFVVIGNTLIREKTYTQYRNLVNMLPEQLRNAKEVVNFRRVTGMGKNWRKGTIVMYCGPGFEEWDDSSMEKGIGGSETAVVEMTRNWAKLGYEVHVYGAVPEVRKFMDGQVTYHPADDIQWEDSFDVFVSWRNPVLFKQYPVSAAKKYLWLHDVPDPYHFTNQVIESVDKVIVLSKYHRGLLPMVPDEKIYVSRNGINLELIDKARLEAKERDPMRLIYGSSPDRGLDFLVDVVGKAQEEFPHLKLTPYYGWQTFDKIRGHYNDKDGIKWKADLQKEMRKLRISDTVRVSKHDLYKAYCESGFWAYPSEFDEISCITAMEAQACGALPITTGHAAVEETQFEGVKTTRKDYLAALKLALSKADSKEMEEIRTEMMAEARKRFAWSTVAEEWAEDLFHGKKLEKFEPLVSVVCLTIRPGPFRVLKETLEKQTYKNFELIVVDGRYDERYKEVAEYMEDFDQPFLHLPDPTRNKKKYPYGLFRADNAMVHAANGELVVFVQDFIQMPEDGIQKYVDLYELQPDMIYTGVDNRVGYEFEGKGVLSLDLSESVDIFLGRSWKLGEEQFVSPRIKIGDALRISAEPMEWELNYAAAPKKILEKLGGWLEDWDTGFGFDNTQLALRFCYEGGRILVDETNKCTAISHWDLFPKDKEGVPDRDKVPNDKKYENYVTMLANTEHTDVTQKFPKPNYPKDIQAKIKEWKNEN